MRFEVGHSLDSTEVYVPGQGAWSLFEFFSRKKKPKDRIEKQDRIKREEGRRFSFEMNRDRGMKERERKREKARERERESERENEREIERKKELGLKRQVKDT